jgi:hypothetical protein
LEGGRLQLQLEEPGRFLFPPVQPNPNCPVKVVERGDGRSPCNTILAQSTLVPYSDGTLLRRSPGAYPSPDLLTSPLQSQLDSSLNQRYEAVVISSADR